MAEVDVQLNDFQSLFSLKGKIAVVTGGSRGLGLHAASAYVSSPFSLPRDHVISQKSNSFFKSLANVEFWARTSMMQAGASKVFISSRKADACEAACKALNALPNLAPGAVAISVPADSATQAGLSAPSRSTVTSQVICSPPGSMGSAACSVRRARRRLPTGTGEVKRTRLRP